MGNFTTKSKTIKLTRFNTRSITFFGHELMTIKLTRFNTRSITFFGHELILNSKSL